MAKECSFFAILRYRYMYRDVIKISSCRVNTTSRRGFLLVLFFFCFPVKAAGSHVHSSQRNPGPRFLLTALHVSESLEQATSRTLSSPEPPGGLSMRTSRLWGHRIFEVLNVRTSSHFRFRCKLEDSLLKSLNHLNLQSLTLLQEQVNAIRNIVENQKWPEVLKSRTSNPVSPDSPSFNSWHIWTLRQF